MKLLTLRHNKPAQHTIALYPTRICILTAKFAIIGSRASGHFCPSFIRIFTHDVTPGRTKVKMSGRVKVEGEAIAVVVVVVIVVAVVLILLLSFSL